MPPVVNFTAWASGFRGPPYFGEFTPLPELYDAYLNPACVSALGVGLCGTIQNAFPYFKTPMHVVSILCGAHLLTGLIVGIVARYGPHP